MFSEFRYGQFLPRGYFHFWSEEEERGTPDPLLPSQALQIFRPRGVLRPVIYDRPEAFAIHE